jgi:hypothetical protein
VGAVKSSPRPPAKVARVVAITRLFRRAQAALGRALPERTARRAPRAGAARATAADPAIAAISLVIA